MVKPMKKRRTIGIRINVFLVLMIILMAAVATILSYFINASQVDAHFSKLDSSIAKTMINLVDTDFIATLSTEIQTEEYREMYDKAVEEEDADAIYNWLKEKGYYDQYESTLKIMADFQQDMNVEYIYFFTMVGRYSYAIMDPREDIFYLGYYYPNEDEFEEFTTNVHIDPTINYSEDYGWLMSGYEPIYDSAGAAVATSGVDINLDDVMAERTNFLWTMIAASAVLIILAVILGIILARHTIVKPLIRLSTDMGKFSPEANSDYEKSHVLNVTYKKNDEIGTVYSGVHDMQTNIVDYLGDITRVTAEKERISAELSIASKIQADIVPTVFPKNERLRLYATMTPAREMGGDFYDFFKIDEDRIGLVMADVSGKGVPAAMFMIEAKALLKNRARAVGSPQKPSEILYDVNNDLCDDNPSSLFVTVWFGILTLSTGSLVCANAGHEYPAILKSGGDYTVNIVDNNPPLATMENLEFEDETIQLTKGDRIFLYTDGVPEAKRNDGARFGMDNMMDILNRDKTLSPEELLDMMKKEIDVFAGDIEPFDDITMMSLVYNG